MCSEELTVSVNDLYFVFDVDNVDAKTTQQGVAALDRRTGRFTSRFPLIPGILLSPQFIRQTSPNSLTNIPAPEFYRVECILGVIRLLGGPYLVIVTQARTIGTIIGACVRAIVEVKLLPISRRPLSASETLTETKYITLVRRLLEDGTFHFSRESDLSRAWQHQDGNRSYFNWGNPLKERLINVAGGEKMMDAAAHKVMSWCYPVIRGPVIIHPSIPALPAYPNLSYAIIARLSNERCGRRYTCRGSNSKGQVVNYVEIEQLFYTSEGEFTSYLQIRGSIPLAWTQQTDLMYNPPIILKASANKQRKSYLAHTDRQLEMYQRQTIVSLIKKSGSEDILGAELGKRVNMERNPKVTYIAFDLHKEVGNGKFENLKKLFELTDKSISSYGFHLETKEKKRIMRTNCKDSLDRTNLIQTRFAIQVAWKQLNALQNIDSEALSPAVTDGVEQFLRISWADAGDVISIMYAGTPAIRGDQTRTGKATILGLINDGINSLTRYYINNFEDGEHQDALDIYFERRPLCDKYELDFKLNPPKKRTKIIEMITSMFVFFFTLIRPTSREGFFNLSFTFIWMGLVFLTWFLFRLDPVRIVNMPVLRYNSVKAKLDDKCNETIEIVHDKED